MVTSNRSKPEHVATPVHKPDERMIFEQALIDLETVCARILDMQLADAHDYGERLQIQQHFKNIVTPVSLALSECKGPRHFHNHYKHSENVDDLLEPAANPPALDVLAETCADAMRQCQKKLVSIHDDDFVSYLHDFEHALRTFMLRHGYYKAKQKKFPAEDMA
ncbi:MAG: hypothetical protein ACK502_05055 [Alphaproteobacteria bacterium]